MNRWVERIPVLVFRQALVAAACVGIAAALVLAGVTWHDALLWLLWLGIPLGLIVVAIWIIDLVRHQ